MSTRRAVAPRSRAPRRGRSNAALLLALAAAALGALVVLAGRSGSSDPARATGAHAPIPGAGPGAQPNRTPGPVDALPDPARGPVAAGPIRVDRATPVGEYERSFDGTGTIAVDVRVPPGVEFPSAWTLHIEPSPFAEGRDRAVRRVRELSGAERSVEEVDLPLAAYRVFATAPGLASLPQEVILHGIAGQAHLPGVRFMRVGTTLQPAAVVAGTVLTSRGSAAEDLPVTLRALGDDTRRIVARTASNGTFTLADVPPGEYTLSFGDADQPLVPRQRIEVLLGRVEVPAVHLPPLVDLELRAIDALERPVPGAVLSGYRRADGGGALRGTTDGQGRLLVRYLPAGPWRFDGTFDELTLAGRHDAELALSGDGKDGAGPDGVQRIDLYLARTEPIR